MLDVEKNIEGNLDSNTPIIEKKTLENMMQLPGKLNLSSPAAAEWVSSRRKNLKPWMTFFQTAKFKMPASAPLLGGRIVKNVEDFQSNYLCIFLVLILYCLLTSPLLLFAVAASLVACHMLSKRNQEKKLVVFNHELSLAQQYALVSACSFPLFWLAGAGTVVFWVLGASMFLIVVHASFYHNDAIEEGFELPVQQSV